MDAFLGLPKWHQWRELPELPDLGGGHWPGSCPRRIVVKSLLA